MKDILNPKVTISTWRNTTGYTKEEDILNHKVDATKIGYCGFVNPTADVLNHNGETSMKSLVENYKILDDVLNHKVNTAKADYCPWPVKVDNILN